VSSELATTKWDSLWQVSDMEATVVSQFVAASQDISLAQWKEMGERLVRKEHQMKWAWGIWWICGRFEHGERKRIVEAQGWEGPSYDTLKNYGSVTKRFFLSDNPEMSLRSDLLPLSWFAVLQPISDENAIQLVDRYSSGDPNLKTRSQFAAEVRAVKERIVDEKKQAKRTEIGETDYAIQEKEQQEQEAIEESRRNAIDDLIRRLQERLQTKVTNQQSKKGGCITISYYSDSDLERVLKLMGVIF
jgi:hypothetical protein